MHRGISRGDAETRRWLGMRLPVPGAPRETRGACGAHRDSGSSRETIHDEEMGMSDGGFAHLDESGRPRMVDVGEKAATRRVAVAEGSIRMSAETLAAIAAGETPKGN